MDEILPNFKILVVQVLTFILGMAAIWKLYIVPLRAHLKARREGIVRELESAEAARREAAELRQELQRERERMASEFQASREAARQEVERLRVELMARAEAQQDQLLRQARERIEGESRRALAEVRTQAADLVIAAASRFVDRKLDSRSDLELARRVVASVGPKG